MGLVDEQWAFLRDMAKLILFIETLPGHKASGGELLRPIEMQELYVKRGASKTMRSRHLEKLAIDINLFIDGKYVADKAGHAALGAYWKSLSPKNRWGGDWGWDANHYERNA